MPVFERDSISLHYETTGEGYPVLLLAPGGLRSAIARWQAVGFSPQQVLSQRGFRAIAMDQRNAGESSAPVSADDGWHSYAADQLALLDHLGIERCHLLGCCIGGSFISKLLQQAPQRFSAATMLQPIGHSDENRETFFELFDGWKEELSAAHPERCQGMQPAAWQQFRERLFGGDFIFSVDREFVKSCQTPLLVMMGDDIYHPSATSREIAELAPNGMLIERWKEAPHREAAVAQMLDFFEALR